MSGFPRSIHGHSTFLVLKEHQRTYVGRSKCKRLSDTFPSHNEALWAYILHSYFAIDSRRVTLYEADTTYTGNWATK